MLCSFEHLSRETHSQGTPRFADPKAAWNPGTLSRDATGLWARGSRTKESMKDRSLSHLWSLPGPSKLAGFNDNSQRKVAATLAQHFKHRLFRCFMPLNLNGALRLLGKIRNGKQFAVALQYIRPAARFINFGAQPVTAFSVPLKMAVF